MTTKLCNINDIADGGSKSLGDDTTSSLFAVRQGNTVYVYQNRCPHASMPLNWMPDRFLTMDKNHIICTAHGAIFTIDSGECIAGPCAGNCLKAISTEVRGGELWLSKAL